MGPRPEYISYFDPVVEFYIVDVIAFLKQDRERYGIKRVKEEKKDRLREIQEYVDSHGKPDVPELAARLENFQM